MSAGTKAIRMQVPFGPSQFPWFVTIVIDLDQPAADATFEEEP